MPGALFRWILLSTLVPVSFDGAPLISEAPAPDVPAACPITPDQHGYPVSAVAIEPASLDSAFLTQMASAAAYRWRVPSPARLRLQGWERVSSRIRPPQPRWADDWRPRARHKARMIVTIYTDSRAPTVSVVENSGDDLFDRSLASMINEPLPDSPFLPPVPLDAGDSVRVELRPGYPATDLARERDIEFAIEQRPVRIAAGGLSVRRPAYLTVPPRATMKYDVSDEGRLILGSIEILDASEQLFADAVEEALRRGRFVAARSNCKPIALTVVQRFGS